MRRVAMLLGLTVGAAGLSAATLDGVLARLEKAETEIKALVFDYTQSVSLSVGQSETRVSGTVSFQRPDRFRVESRGTSPQTVVSDGTHLWIYSPAHKQVIKDTLSGLLGARGAPAGLGGFQWKVADMKKEFNIALENADDDVPVLVLTPKSAAGSTTLRLWIDMDRGVAVKTTLVADGVKTDVSLTDVRVNPRLSKNLFQFKPPAGVELVDMPTPLP